LIEYDNIYCAKIKVKSRTEKNGGKEGDLK
jgi:hypothetical protein